MKLKGKTAVVTGGARDIGREVAIKLAKEGANVVVNYFLNQEDGDTTLKLIEEAGGKAIIVQGDMTKQEDIDNLVSESKKAFGEEVHVLVNVAGGLIARKTIEEMDVDFFDVMINVSFKAVFLVTKAFKPLMKSGA